MVSDIKIIEQMFNDYFSSGKDNPEYRIEVSRLSENNSRIEACLTFMHGQSYCCAELTCHFKADWDRIRAKAIKSGLVLGQLLIIEFSVVVDNGALIKVNESIGAPLASEKYQYIEIFQESESET